MHVHSINAQVGVCFLTLLFSFLSLSFLLFTRSFSFFTSLFPLFFYLLGFMFMFFFCFLFQFVYLSVLLSFLFFRIHIISLEWIWRKKLKLSNDLYNNLALFFFSFSSPFLYSSTEIFTFKMAFKITGIQFRLSVLWYFFIYMSF